jgi:hypothetical protein
MSLRSTAVNLMAAWLLAAPAEPQKPPNFSGHWVLVEALLTGPGRNSANEDARPRSTTTTTISGAPFNCGRECTITHKGTALTIANAQLADYPGKDKSKPTPPVTIQLDGREAKVIDTFNPHMMIAAVAKWQDAKVHISSAGVSSSIARTQVLSLEDGHLVVANLTERDGEPRPEVTFKYRRQ